ncbi:MAG: DUF167 domain-containing protein [Armatimonadota bacterium]|nr:DUF167 domain-containing protein [Armatimonadota bacterium]
MRLSVHVTPRARHERVERLDATTLRVAVTAPPHEGRANAAIIEAVAAYLGVAPSRVRIVRGHAARRKVLDIEEQMP